MREISSRSSINCICKLALRSIVSIARAALSSSSIPVCNIPAQPMIAVMGVRSSWETIAKNSSLERLADSAAQSAASLTARAACSRASNCSRSSSTSLRSVKSCKILAKPRSFPSSPRNGVTTPCAQNRVPSLRTCQRLSLDIPSVAAWLSACSGMPCSIASGVKMREKF